MSWLVGVVLIWAVIAGGAVQIPFSTHRTALKNPEGSLGWDLDATPNPNATGHLVFETVSSLLQHWPNTRYRTGHNIVPGTIPTGTLLYHGRADPKLPATPEWIATDPEHSYLFSRDRTGPGCWHLTLVATRPLRVLYFDGSSAAKMQDGPMDSQDVVTWREIKPRPMSQERERIKILCDWGKPFGLDGFIRMEMNFEIMYCDFTAGVEIVTFSNLVSSRGLGHLPPPPKDPPSLSPPEVGIRAADLNFEVIHSGTWHNRYPGDTRIQLDLTGLVSFYDTDLVPSLVAVRQGQERWDHRLLGIDSHDIDAVMNRLTAALKQWTRKPQSGSGVDWKTLLRVVVDRYADRLDLIQYLLNSTVDGSDGLAQAKKVQTQFRVMLTPYILYSVAPPVVDSKSNNTWASPVFKLCATTHISYITSNPALHSKLTDSELLLLRAIQETNREICRVIVGLWAEGVVNGLDDLLSVDTMTAVTTTNEAELLSKWRSEIHGLMDWLDWSVWVKCRPGCGIEEICYLPTWPYFRRRPGGPGPGRRRPPGEESTEFIDEDDTNEWERPQPKCIRRFEPYGF